jgi:eukaryotic-like serine/threonine-protein kinase
MSVASDTYFGNLQRSLELSPLGVRARTYRIKATRDPFVGKQLGTCKVLSRAGQGAMAIVYKAQQDVTGRPVAIKILRYQLSRRSKNVKRFEREARAMSKLNHPNLISVYEVGLTPSKQPYFVMEYLEGKTLQDLLDLDGAVPWERALPIFLQVAEAMDHAHRKGVIHRDLKPGNIMLTSSGAFNDQVKIVDFGIAKVEADSGLLSQRLTATGEVWGTPYYMSPEQCMGNPLDARSDIYALGVVMYECLMGKHIFEAKNLADLISKQINQMPERFPLRRPELSIPTGLETIVLKSLQKDPSFRYQSMLEVRIDLEAGLFAAHQSGSVKLDPQFLESLQKAVGLELANQKKDNGSTSTDAAGGKPKKSVETIKVNAVNSNQDPHIGTKLSDRYTIVSKIGEGGMSVVYKARQDAVDRFVAIKMLHLNLCEEEKNVKRFQREAKAISRLTHPHLVTVHDVGTADTGQPFYVMELLKGFSLAEKMAGAGRLTPEVALPIFSQVCDAMDYAHKNGIVHRDLKPDNVMLLQNATSDNYVKLVDFGIIKALDAGLNTQRLTKTGEVWGSPVYMSPEQCMGEDLDGRSDIYSLGTLMYEVFTGKYVFDDKRVTDVIAKQVTDMPRNFASVIGEDKIPLAVEEIVFKALQKDKRKRFQTMEDMKLAIDKQIKRMRKNSVALAKPSTESQKPEPSKSQATTKKSVMSPQIVVVALLAFAFTAIIVAIGALGYMVYQGMSKHQTLSAPPAKYSDRSQTPSAAEPAHTTDHAVPVQGTPEPAAVQQPTEEAPLQDQASADSSVHDTPIAPPINVTGQQSGTLPHHPTPGTTSGAAHHTQSKHKIQRSGNVIPSDVLDPSQRPHKKFKDPYKYYDEPLPEPR